jgi:nucleotide-binding universal stress UspA family protein
MERKRLESLIEDEAEGGSFWTDSLDAPTKRKIAFVLSDASASIAERGTVMEYEPWRIASVHFARENGFAVRLYEHNEIAQEPNEDIVFSFIEIFAEMTYQLGLDGDLVREVNRIFDEHRVNFQMAPNRQIVPRDSAEVHANVTLPAIQLLHGRADLRLAETAYMDALREIADGKPADAITDACVALQETLTVLGATGPTLKAQLTAAKTKTALLTGRDQPLLDGISRFVEWASAERNSNSDAHKVTAAVLDDAWLMVHVVGALILRLAGAPRA